MKKPQLYCSVIVVDILIINTDRMGWDCCLFLFISLLGFHVVVFLCYMSKDHSDS